MERDFNTETPYWERETEEKKEDRADAHSSRLAPEKPRDFTFDDWASI